jgi:hypothetical protein
MNPDLNKKQDYSYVQPVQQPPQYVNTGASYTPQPYMAGQQQQQPFIVNNTIVVAGGSSALASSRGNMTVVGILLVIVSILGFVGGTTPFVYWPGNGGASTFVCLCAVR